MKPFDRLHFKSMKNPLKETSISIPYEERDYEKQPKKAFNQPFFMQLFESFLHRIKISCHFNCIAYFFCMH